MPGHSGGAGVKFLSTSANLRGLILCGASGLVERPFEHSWPYSQKGSRAVMVILVAAPAAPTGWSAGVLSQSVGVGRDNTTHYIVCRLP